MRFSKHETENHMFFTQNEVNSLADVATPALLLDRARLESNCSRMLGRMSSLDVALRPHMKTAKSTDVAHIACGNKYGPITVSTLNEALWFARQGFQDLLYAVGFSPAKLNMALEVLGTGAPLSLITDNEPVAAEMGSQFHASGHEVAVLIELDCGHGRGGVLPESRELLHIAKQLDDSPGTRLAGVLTHAGHSYNCSSLQEIIAVAEEERVTAVTAARRLREAGRSCAVISVGSTPTARHAQSLEGVTEMRPGVYQFGDLAQVCLGSCRFEDIAISVLTTVIGHNRHSGVILVDAGGLALSRDQSSSLYRDDLGYGVLCEESGELIAPLACIGRLEQEHGFIDVKNHAGFFDRFPIGSRLRVLPNHACMTAAAYPGYWVIGEGSETRPAYWPRCNGWRPT